MPASVHSSPQSQSSDSASNDEPSSLHLQQRRSLAIRETQNGHNGQNGSKRKRGLTNGSRNGPTNGNGHRAASRRRTSHALRDNDQGNGNMSDEYDPDQSMAERRRLQRAFRDLQKDIVDNMEEYMQPTSKGLQQTLLRADELSRNVKQTNEAAIDSRLLITTIDLSYRKTLRLVQGGASQGVDVDEFVSKCITYMRQGGGIADDNAPALSSTQRHHRHSTRRGALGDDDDENDETLNWPHLGRYGCLPTNRRPALSGFLIGPLSSEKKARKITKRNAPLRREDLAEIRPEVLDVDELTKKENDLTAVCARILKQLRDVQVEAQTTLRELFEQDPNMSDEEQSRLMHKHGLRATGGVDLLRFVVNPKSFGQTVENMFYVSFLIRDGRVEVKFDESELPSLSPIEQEEGTQTNGASKNPMKHQAIFSMDMSTWRDIIETFDIKQPMIEHRKEPAQAGPGARGWYS